MEFSHLVEPLKVGDKDLKFYNVRSLDPAKYDKLPYSIRVLLEAAVRKCDGFQIKSTDVENILGWSGGSQTTTDVPFQVLLAPVFTQFSVNFDNLNPTNRLSTSEKTEKLSNYPH